jgi:hypothetical protein
MGIGRLINVLQGLQLDLVGLPKLKFPFKIMQKDLGLIDFHIIPI